MANAKTLHCHVLTPDSAMLECDAISVVLPAHDGQIGFLKNRAPLLCKLGLGELRVVQEQSEQRFFIDGGFAQMLNNELTILTQSAESAEDIDPTDARVAVQQATNLPADNADRRDARAAAILRARARVRVARPR